MTGRLFGTGLWLAAALLTFGCGGSKPGDAPATPPRGPATAAPAGAMPAVEPESSLENPPAAVAESKGPAGGTRPSRSNVLGAIGRAVRGAIGKPADAAPTDEAPAEAPKYRPAK
ncbi:MAG: hypothetical protein QM844_21135 [Planctomycetota bacterium]|nr:hypothetical protein [Planctomycetota bacterium]